LRRDALVLDGDRDPADLVLRRTAALVRDLKKSGSARLIALEKELVELQAASDKIDADNTAARYVLYADACRLRRQIAFCNPLLSFQQILFIKRHRTVYNHMCDQYYGITARPGGRLFVLANPFGVGPAVRDLLAGRRVERGRLKGQSLPGGSGAPVQLSYNGVGGLNGPDLDGGSFLSPELSYDGKSILFAYVVCKGDKEHRAHLDPTRGHWAEGRCYHIFKVNADGSGLERFTWDPSYS
jgi:hypothetical protein